MIVVSLHFRFPCCTSHTYLLSGFIYISYLYSTVVYLFYSDYRSHLPSFVYTEPSRWPVHVNVGKIRREVPSKSNGVYTWHHPQFWNG